MKGGGSSKALANQQAQALAAQQAQAALANQNVAADSAIVQSGGTADSLNGAANNALIRNKNRKGLAASLGLNV